MLNTAPSIVTKTLAYQPVLDVLESVLIAPGALAAHWGYTEEHLCNLRKNSRGLPFIKLETGGIRYRVSEVVAAELRGTAGPLTLERVLLAVASCASISIDARAAMQAHVRAAFAPG